jgi:two-component system OmpR family response regulator
MPAPAANILIVEDDLEIGDLVADVIRREGFNVVAARDAPTMDGLLTRLRPDLVILDLMLPGEDGLSICRRLRAQENYPILMLTAKGEEIDKVLGLEMGADDYLVKPFGSRELVARVRAMLRREARSTATLDRRLTFDAFTIDLDARRLELREAAAVTLTDVEFDLLACFVQRPRRVLTREQLFNWTRGRTLDPLDRTIDMNISRLRRKLEAANPGSSLITTVRNGGYLFTAHVKRVH